MAAAVVGRGERVDFVEREQDGAGEVLQKLGGAAVVVVRRVGGIGDKQDDLDIGERRARVFDQGFAQFMLRLVNAGRVEKDDLEVVAAVQNAGDAVARGLGARRNDDVLAAQQSVES